MAILAEHGWAFSAAMESFGSLSSEPRPQAAMVLWLVVLAIRRDTGEWAKMPLPLGTFLCVAGLVEIFYPAWLLNPDCTSCSKESLIKSSHRG